MELARPETIRLFLRYLRYHPSRCCRRCPPLLRYRCRNHPPMLVGLPGKYLPMPCLALSCLDTPTPHRPAQTTPGALLHGGRRHASGPLWLPSALNSARVAIEKGGEGQGPCSEISTATRALQSGGTQLSKPKVLLAAGRPGMA